MNCFSHYRCLDIPNRFIHRHHSSRETYQYVYGTWDKTYIVYMYTYRSFLDSYFFAERGRQKNSLLRPLNGEKLFFVTPTCIGNSTVSVHVIKNNFQSIYQWFGARMVRTKYFQLKIVLYEIIFFVYNTFWIKSFSSKI